MEVEIRQGRCNNETVECATGARTDLGDKRSETLIRELCVQTFENGTSPSTISPVVVFVGKCHEKYTNLTVYGKRWPWFHKDTH